MVKVRVSPGWRLGSPVSPTLASSSTLSAPVVTGAGGSPASATGSWSNGVSVLRTIISCSIVPRFFTTNVTSPAGALSTNGTSDIGPLVTVAVDERDVHRGIRRRRRRRDRRHRRRSSQPDWSAVHIRQRRRTPRRGPRRTGRVQRVDSSAWSRERGPNLGTRGSAIPELDPFTPPCRRTANAASQPTAPPDRAQSPVSARLRPLTII